MKTKLLSIALLFVALIFKAQSIIPNSNFINDLNGWTVSGTNISMFNSHTYLDGDGVLALENSSYSVQNYVLKSPVFPLFANEIYGMNIRYGYYDFYAMMGANQLGQISSIVVKNSAGTVVNTLVLNCDPAYGGGGPARTDLCSVNTFLITATDNYYLEITGSLSHLVESEYIQNWYHFDYFYLYKDTASNSVQGKITYDTNNDNCATSSFTPSNIPIKSTSSSFGNVYFSNSNSSGNYGSNFNDTGLVTSKISNTAIISNPLNYTDTFTAPQIITNNNFCIKSTIPQSDVSVVIVPTSFPRPGFNSNYRIYYTNNGGTNASGTVNFTYQNALINHLSSVPTENSATSNTLAWNYSNLLPFETRIIDVFFNINTPPTVNNGDNLSFTGTISPFVETNTLNNTFNLMQIANGSYDPNDATILQGPFITSSQALQDLYFKIRFQNTGTASAININVNTELDSNIDWSTFTPVYASHDFTTSVNGNEVNFKFDNINLPDSTTDEPNSNGYIVFKAKPVSGFGLGDLISNKANIYFDYNLPITTNTATTQIEAPLAVDNSAQIENLVSVYPNPVKDVIVFSMKRKGSFDLINTNGQIIKKGKLEVGENRENVSNLPTGIYLLKIEIDGKVITKKLIKK